LRDPRKRQRLDADLHVGQETPSFFCRFVDDVVYWKSSFFSG
jgi:hypothetical protein